MSVIVGGSNDISGQTPASDAGRQEVKLAGVSFKDDPVKFCKAVYDEFHKHNKKKHETIIRNRKFYEGEDDYLDERRNNPAVKRSAVFDNEVRPSWDSVRATIIDGLSEYENPVRMIINETSDDDPELIAKQEVAINREMRECGFLGPKLEDMIMEAGCSPVVACKVGWEIKEGWIYEKYQPLEKVGRMILGVLSGRGLQVGLKKKWGVKTDRPYVDGLDFDEFLYDPSANDMDSQRAVCHAKMMPWNDFTDMAIEKGWRKEAVAKMKEEYDSIVGEGEEGGARDTMTGQFAREVDPDREAEYRTGKVLVCEFWVPTYDAVGRKEMRIYYLGANKYPLCKERYGEPSDRGEIDYPFAVLRFNKHFNRLEGTPPVETVIPAQRLVNDYTNAVNDGLTYGLFSPILKEATTDIGKQPVFGPGEFWEISKIDGIRPLFAGMQLPDLAIPIQAREEQRAKIRQILNAPDTAQGMDQPNDQEKATKTRMREMGTMRRARINHKLVGDFILEVAQMFIYLHQANGEEDWLLDVTLDVPALTGAYSPMEEKERAVMLFTMAAQNNPVYMVPTGLKKLRNLWADVLDKFRIRDKDSVCPTENEMDLVNPLGQQIEQAANEPENAMPVEQGVVPGGGQTGEENSPYGT